MFLFCWKKSFSGLLWRNIFVHFPRLLKMLRIIVDETPKTTYFVTLTRLKSGRRFFEFILSSDPFEFGDVYDQWESTVTKPVNQVRDETFTVGRYSLQLYFYTLILAFTKYPEEASCRRNVEITKNSSIWQGTFWEVVLLVQLYLWENIGHIFVGWWFSMLGRNNTCVEMFKEFGYFFQKIPNFVQFHELMKI